MAALIPMLGELRMRMGEHATESIRRGLLSAALASASVATLKIVAFFFSGSLLVLASGLDSLVDTAMSLINRKLHMHSTIRADREHPYGHGGIEIIAALVQGMLVGGTGLFILGESLLRFYRGSHATELHQTGFGFALAILLFSSVAAFLIHAFLQRVKMKQYSSASLVLEADLAHYRADGFTNLSAGVALLAIWLTGFTVLDAVFGLVSSMLLLWTAYPVLRLAFLQILQHELDAETQQRVVDEALAADPRVISVHRLRTRAAGPTRYFDFHLRLSRHLPLNEAHAVGETVMAAIKREFPRSDVIIHLDPDDEPEDDLWEPAYDRPK